MIHKLPIRIYYQDTDAGGIVYHANYLKFAERARTEFLHEKGISITELKNKGIMTVVKLIEMDFKSPAFLEDEIIVETTIKDIQYVKMIFDQKIMRQGKELVSMKITVVFISPEALKPVRLPNEIKTIFLQGEI